MDITQTTSWKTDYLFIFTVFLLALVSIITLASVQSFLPAKLQTVIFVKKQIIWYGIGTFAALFCSYIDYARFQHSAWYLYTIGILLLLGLELPLPSNIVQPINGATSWYQLPGVGNIQPSEIMKLFFIFGCSSILTNYKEKLDVGLIDVYSINKEEWLMLFKLTGVYVLPLLFLARQPDLGMGMVYTSIFITYLVISGIRWKLLLPLFFSVFMLFLLLIVLFVKFPSFIFHDLLHDYQLGRVYGWLSPYQYEDAYGYQLIQSLKAVGSGTLHGTGFGHVHVSLPEAHTDFIFAMIAEQFGFVGGSVVVSLFFLLIYRIVLAGLNCHDPFGSYICAGVAGMIGFQVFQNIGMTIGLLPITGLPLPFISYGGSSLVTYMAAVGLIINVYGRSNDYMFT